MDKVAYDALSKDAMRLATEVDRLRLEIERLRKAASDVCAYDWSDNDADAVHTISVLRKLIGEDD